MRRVLQVVSVAVLLICLGSHVSEIFDRWDHTLQTGNDIESAVVVLALTVGVALAAAGTHLIVSISTKAGPLHAAPALIFTCTGDDSRHLNVSHSPPPLALRI